MRGSHSQRIDQQTRLIILDHGLWFGFPGRIKTEAPVPIPEKLY
jgi:hypothetical protein